jgi:multidrug efflux system outer membrane protein
MPTIAFDPSYQRERYSPNQVPGFGNVTANAFTTPFDLSYEVDLWGRVRRNFESSRAEAQASLADYYNVLLTLNSDVAQNYFSLRSLDAEIATVSSTVKLRHDQVRLTGGRFKGGVGNNLDMAQAKNNLATTEAEAASLAQQRDQLENAIAILVGRNPSAFKLPALTETNWEPSPPEIPAGLPADLLERRPDVAQAERQLASANAQIGVAKAAFFPVLTLTGSGGFLSADVSSMFNWESRQWSFGPGISLPIFAGGRNRANYRRSQAAYQEAVANYRQQVLVAFGDVENSLSAIRHLAVQSEAQKRAVQSALQAAEFSTDRYRAGVVAYLSVVDAERDTLTAQQADAQLSGQRLIAAVQLIKALGGGWDEKPTLTGSAKLADLTASAK